MSSLNVCLRLRTFRLNSRNSWTSLSAPLPPPAEMVFFEGDFYTARGALEDLVKSAKHRVVIVDGYVSALTLDVLDVRANGVEAVIYPTANRFPRHGGWFCRLSPNRLYRLTS